MVFSRDHALATDWHNQPLNTPLQSLISLDDSSLVFRTSQAALCSVHPTAKEGLFQPELWKYDVAELFLGEPETGRYLEVNLAPNGAWWACWFDAVRQASPVQPDFRGVMAKGSVTEQGWEAEIALPLSLFLSPKTLTYNVTAILGSPEQQFFTALPLEAAEPDFHRPAHFGPLFRSEHS